MKGVLLGSSRAQKQTCWGIVCGGGGGESGEVFVGGGGRVVEGEEEEKWTWDFSDSS